MTEARYLYVCPECGQQFQVPGMHQHENGEWIDNQLVQNWIKMRQWDALLAAKDGK